jgi:hypothetical protein
MYQWLLYGHLIGVILLVLGTGVFIAGVDGLRRCDDIHALRTSLAIATLGTRTLAPGGVLLLGFGIAMATLRWSLTDAWIAAALLLVALLGANGLHAERRLRVLATALDRTDDAALPPAVRRLSRAPALHASNRAGLPLLAELEYLMTMKPTAGPLTISLLIAAAAVGVVALTTVAPLRPRRPA